VPAHPGRPDFIVIGAMKSGTSSLHSYLAQHPHVVTSEPKETDFFVKDRSEAKAERYASLFRDAPSDAAAGESSPNYTKAHLFPGIPQRIHAACPDVHLIYLVRDPVDRVVSHYQHELHRGREKRPFLEALETKDKYLATSRYAWQLDHYLEVFPPQQLLVVTTSGLAQRPQAVLGDIFRFLGVDPDVPIDTSERRNTAARKNRDRDLPEHGLEEVDGRLRADAATRQRLVDLLGDDIERMRPWVGDEADRWQQVDKAPVGGARPS
jgi:hypothetical protein